MNNREVVVLSAVRTAIGKFGGALKDVPPTELAAKVVSESVQRSGLAAADVGNLVFGNVIHTEAKDMYLARVAALRGGLPVTTPALTLNRSVRQWPSGDCFSRADDRPRRRRCGDRRRRRVDEPGPLLAEFDAVGRKNE